MKIPIASIIVRERQRKEIGDLSDLDSMGDPNIGQIQAIGVNERTELIWGMRRLTKAKLLGWSEIEAVKREGLSPVDEQLVEFYEDIQRKDRSWQEKCTAVAKIHWMMGGENPGWSQKQTAAATGFSQQSVSYMLTVAEALDKGDEELAKCTSYFEAIKVLVTRRRDEATKELERRRQQAAVFEAATDRAGVDNAEEMYTEEDSDGNPIPPYQGLVSSASPEEVLIPLRGHDTLTKVGKEFNLIIGYKFQMQHLPILARLLYPTGTLVLWHDSPVAFENLSLSAEDAGLHPMPWPLVWCKGVAGPRLSLPFTPSYAIGVVMFKKEPLNTDPPHPNPTFSHISAPPYGGDLPASVVNHVCSALALRDEPVLTLGAINPADVAAAGNLPTWYEPEPDRFKERADALEVHYMETVPGARVVR